MPVADMQWLAVRFRSPALEQAFLSYWSRVLWWLDVALALVSLSVCSSWAAAYAALRRGIPVNDLWSLLTVRLGLWSPAEQQQTCAVEDSQTECAAVYDISQWPHLLSMLIALTVLCSTCNFVGCSLAVWHRRDLSQHRIIVVQLSWCLTKVYTVVAAIAHCSLGYPGVSCKAVSWFAVFLAVATPMYVPFWSSAVCSMLYCLLWLISLRLPDTVHVSLRQHVMQLLIQAVVPVAVQFALRIGLQVHFTVHHSRSAAAVAVDSGPLSSAAPGRPLQEPEDSSPSRTSSPSERSRHEEESHGPQQGHLQQQTGLPGEPDLPRAGQPTASAAAAMAAAAAAVAASSSTDAEQVMAAGTPTVVVAALPSLNDIGRDGATTQQSGASLVYESPLLHRTIGVKVYSTSGVSRQMVASRLAASVQAALDSLPQGVRIVDQTGNVGPLMPTAGNSSAAQGSAEPQAVLVNRVLVPGCVMLLGQVIIQQYKSQKPQLRAQAQITASGLICGGFWRVELGSAKQNSQSLGKHTGAPWRFQSIQQLEAAVADGSCAGALQTWLDTCATDTFASDGDCDSLQPQSVVSAWGRELRLLLAQTAANDISPGHSFAVTDLPVRLVLAHGNDVIMDQQVAVPGTVHKTGNNGNTFTWPLSHQLPNKKLTDGISLGLSAGACALTLYVLSSQSQNTLVKDDGSSEVDTESKQLASITIILLPQEAAEEFVAWVHSSSITHGCLQALLQDMAAALQACTTATTVGIVTAAVAGTTGGKTHDCTAASAAKVSAAAAAAEDAIPATKLPPSYWATAMAAAVRGRLFLEAQGLERCSSIIQRCLQQLQALLGRDGI